MRIILQNKVYCRNGLFLQKFDKYRILLLNQMQKDIQTGLEKRNLTEQTHILL